jgi:putative peptidoglycan lipid II flippase
MAAPIQTGSVTALQFAQRLYQFPVGVFGVAIATAIFPALSHAAANDDSDSFATTVRHGLRLTVFIGLPASVGLIVVRDPLVRLLFERGEFDATSTTRVASILIGYASAVWAYSMTHVITRAFYAMKDAKTPLRVAVVMVILNLALNLTLVWWLGAAGLAWSTAICAAIQSALLVKLLGRRVDHPVDASVWSGWRRTLMLSVVMGIIIAPVNFVIDTSSMSALASALVLLGQVAIGAIVFLIGAKVTKSDELTWLLKRKAV